VRRALRSATLAAVAAALLGTAFVTGCLDRGPEDLLGNTGADPLDRQTWTVILSDDAGGVWVAQSDSAFAVHGGSPEAAAASFWSVLDSAPDLDHLTLAAQVEGREMSWTLSRSGELLGSGRGALFSYVGGTGAPRFVGTATMTRAGVSRQLRFDAIGGLPMPAEPAPPPPPLPPAIVSGGVVSLRIDDCAASDSVSLALLARRHLVASFAVPTRLVGRPGRCPRRLLDSMIVHGNAVEAHSRFHGTQPATFADFYLETVGASRDLRAMGFEPRVFVQPGSWRSGPAFFDSPAKMATPYGALLRRVYRAVEAYQTLEPAVPYPSGGRWPYAGEIRYYSTDRLAAFLRDASARGEWVELLWHSGDQPWAALDDRLAVVEAMRDSGYIANVTFRDALRARAAP
jgi:hypothetical protein